MLWMFVVFYALTTLVYTWFAGTTGLGAWQLVGPHSLCCAATVFFIGFKQRWWEKWRPLLGRALLSGCASVSICIGSLLGVVHKELLVVQLTMRSGTLILGSLFDLQTKWWKRWILSVPVLIIGGMSLGKLARKWDPLAKWSLVLYLGGYAVKYLMSLMQKLYIDSQLKSAEAAKARGEAVDFSTMEAEMIAQETSVSVLGLILTGATIGGWEKAWDQMKLWRVIVTGVCSQLGALCWSKLLAAKWRLSTLVPVMRSIGLMVGIAVTVLRDGKEIGMTNWISIAVLFVVALIGSRWK